MIYQEYIKNIVLQFKKEPNRKLEEKNRFHRSRNENTRTTEDVNLIGKLEKRKLKSQWDSIDTGLAEI